MTGTNDFAQVAAQTRQRMEQARQLRERLAELVGRAESDDGAVRAKYTDADGLAGLVINPRLLRLGSAELAETIMRVARDARTDLEARKREAMREVYGSSFDPEGMVDAAAVRARLDEAAEVFRRASGDTAAVLDLVRKATGG
jgi:DNA-binding protein YbaB